MGIKILKYSKYFEKRKDIINVKMSVEYKCMCVNARLKICSNNSE